MQQRQEKLGAPADYWTPTEHHRKTALVRAALTLRHIQPVLTAKVHAMFIKTGTSKHRKPFEREPVDGPLRICTEAVDGDNNLLSDDERAVLIQSLRHYSTIRTQFGASHEGQDERLAGGRDQSGSGENLLVDGVDCSTVCLGDVFRCGGLVLQVTCPRKPCKRWTHTYESNPGTGIRRFVMRNALGGWFCQVLREGSIGPGDELKLVERPYPQWSLQRLNHLFYGNSDVVDDSPAEAVWCGTREEFLELREIPCLCEREWGDVLEKLMKQGTFEA